MMQLVIFIPRTESSLSLLRNALPMFIKRFGKVALPLPKEFCSIAVANPGNAVEMLREVVGEAFVRLWGWVPGFFREAMVEYPFAYFDCYYDMDRLRRSIDTSIEIARLVLRYRLGAKVDLNDWLAPFSSIEVVRVPDDYVVIIDDYAVLRFFEKTHGFRDIVALGPLVPTPIELLELIALGILSREYLMGVIEHVVRYVDDYVVLSRDLTEALLRLINDRDYLSFIHSLDL
jgi:hypothetical protein